MYFYSINTQFDSNLGGSTHLSYSIYFLIYCASAMEIRRRLMRERFDSQAVEGARPIGGRRSRQGIRHRPRPSRCRRKRLALSGGIERHAGGPRAEPPGRGGDSQGAGRRTWTITAIGSGPAGSWPFPIGMTRRRAAGVGRVRVVYLEARRTMRRGSDRPSDRPRVP